MESERKLGARTMALHSGWRSDPATGAFGLPIYTTAGYEFKSAAHAASVFDLSESGYIYSRLGNPTVSALEETLADLEGGVAAVATSSGQAAVTLLISALTSPGSHVLVASAVYGGTFTLMKNHFARFGVDVEFFDVNHPCLVQSMLREETRAILVETIGNPVMDVAPIGSLASLAARHNIPLIVDNTFSPLIAAPLQQGANIVIYSTTKYISGLGNVIGGAVIDGGNFDWRGPKWSFLNSPDPAYHGLVYTEHFGPAALAAKLRTSQLRDIGACVSPFDAYLLRQSLMTLPLRMQAHSAGGLAVAEFLAGHEEVESVRYPGLAGDPSYELAREYLPQGAGGMLIFTIKGGYESGVRFLNALQIFARVANVGDCRSLAIHPASTTHSQLSPDERRASGIDEGMIRLSVGLEDICDLTNDLARALAEAN